MDIRIDQGSIAEYFGEDIIDKGFADVLNQKIQDCAGLVQVDQDLIVLVGGLVVPIDSQVKLILWIIGYFKGEQATNVSKLAVWLWLVRVTKYFLGGHEAKMQLQL